MFEKLLMLLILGACATASKKQARKRPKPSVSTVKTGVMRVPCPGDKTRLLICTERF